VLRILIVASLLSSSAIAHAQIGGLLKKVKPRIERELVKAPDTVPEIFYSTRWGIDENACRAPTDKAPGLIVFTPTGVTVDGRSAMMFKAKAKGTNFMRAPFMFGDQPGIYRDLRFAVRGQQTLDYGEYVNNRLQSRGTYTRCSLRTDEPPPRIPELMQSATWGTNAVACRRETPVGDGLVEFGENYAIIEGARADMGRAIAQGSNFLRAPFHFTNEDGFVTTRDLGFSVIDNRKLTFREYHSNNPTDLGTYYICPK
jgi:hypothetical protein